MFIFVSRDDELKLKSIVEPGDSIIYELIKFYT